MEQETINKILFVIQALNNTYVSGKQNLVNLSVSIDTLEGDRPERQAGAGQVRRWSRADMRHEPVSASYDRSRGWHRSDFTLPRPLLQGQQAI